MNEDQINDGLRERIAKAETPGEVKSLLELGSTYTQASDRSRRAWRNTAQRRLAELHRIESQPVAAEDRGALDQADKEARMVKTALHGMRYSTPLCLGGVR